MLAGLEPERVSSCIYIVGYTFVGSLPLLGAGLYWREAQARSSVRLTVMQKAPVILLFALFLTFLIKIPV